MNATKTIASMMFRNDFDGKNLTDYRVGQIVGDAGCHLQHRRYEVISVEFDSRWLKSFVTARRIDGCRNEIVRMSADCFRP